VRWSAGEAAMPMVYDTIIDPKGTVPERSARVVMVN
jgi:hypothetical protein